MPKFFVENNQIDNNIIEVIGEDVNHIKNVLRAKKGDEIEICNLLTQETFLCNIYHIYKEKIMCQILNKIKRNSEPNIKVTIYQGLPKSDKMEHIIQKSVELGVYNIIPLEMNRCVVKFDEKDKLKKIQRWQKISEVAAKQSGRNMIPEICSIVNIKNVCNLCSEYDIVLVAYENETKNNLKNEILKLKNVLKEELRIAVVIGPEGGIEESEVELLNNSGAKIVTLGKRILRTETVALNILSIIMYELEK